MGKLQPLKNCLIYLLAWVLHCFWKTQSDLPRGVNSAIITLTITAYSFPHVLSVWINFPLFIWELKKKKKVHDFCLTLNCLKISQSVPHQKNLNLSTCQEICSSTDVSNPFHSLGSEWLPNPTVLRWIPLLQDASKICCATPVLCWTSLRWRWKSFAST